jgi:hypothetical protein
MRFSLGSRSRPPQTTMRKQGIPSLLELSAESQALIDVFNKEIDLAVIVISASWLDGCLGTRLQGHLRDSTVSERILNPIGGAAGNFAARADLCYALRLIEKPMYQDLILVAQVRNVVAHNHLLVTFEMPEIKKLIQQLKFVDLDLKDLKGQSVTFLHGLPTARSRFIFTTAYLGQHIQGVPLRLGGSGPAA